MIALNPTLASPSAARMPALQDAAALQASLDARTTLLDSVRELLAAGMQRLTGPQDDGVLDHNGAPALDLPLTEFSGDELALLLSALDTKIKDTQARTAKEGIELARVQKQTANTEMLDKIQEAIDQQKEAAEKEKSQKVWGWLGKIAAFIGAVAAVIVSAAATIVSGGVGAALLIVAVVGLVAATTDLASQINQEVNPGAEPFSLGSLIGDAIIQAMDDEGVDGTDRAAAAGLGAALGFLLMQPDLAGQMAEASALADGRSADFASGMRLGVMIAAVVFTVAMTIALTVASGGASSANLVSSTAKNAMKAATYLQATAAFTQGVASVGSGATQIAVAYDQRDADEARAAAKAIEAVLAELSAQSEEQIARLRDIIESLQEGMLMFSQMVDTAGDQRANLVRNLVRA